MSLKNEVNRYDAAADLSRAQTPPSSWYTDPEFYALENDTVFKDNWLLAARADQLTQRGQYLALQIGGEPIVLVMDDELRAFYNVCRHHASHVMQGEGTTNAMHCPYHGWTYNLDGSLRSTPQFAGAEDFDRSDNGLVPIRVGEASGFVWICMSDAAPSLDEFLGPVAQQIVDAGMDELSFYRRVEYDLDCNWKVFVDNYLDGGYHVPILHKGLNNAIDYKQYEVELGDQFVTQSVAMSNSESAEETRRGSKASYIWLYPNVMFNFYDGILDSNLVLPLPNNRCKVIFDFFFTDGLFDDAFKDQSIEVSHQVQMEDEYACHAVQSGLGSRAYDIGRLSPEKEAGEHLFHKLLHRDLSAMFK